MSKSKESTKVEAKLNATAKSALVKALSDAYGTAATFGESIINTVCVTASQFIPKGAEVSKDDMEEIVGKVARVRNWSDASLPPRMSEVRVLLRARSTLPEAMKKFRAANDHCTWHDGMKVARALNKVGGDVGKALALVKQSAKAAKVEDPKAAKRAAAIRIKKVLELPHLPRDFKAGLRQLCADHSISV